jgi:hypothetical protein
MNVAALAALQSWPPPCEDNHGLPLAGEALCMNRTKGSFGCLFVFVLRVFGRPSPELK